MIMNRAYRIFSSLLEINRTYITSTFEKYAFNRTHNESGHTNPPSADDVLTNPYLFVLSSGRCGTALITAILSKSPKLRVEHNPKPELEYVSSLVHRENTPEDALRIAVLAARFDLFFLDSFLRGKIYVETNNRISLFSPALAKLLPNAKFIHLVRDPADFVRSGMRRGYYREGAIQYQRLDGSKHAPWTSFSRLEKIAWEWNEINLKIEEFKDSVDSSRILTVKSESLYKDPSTTSAIFDFIRIENPFSRATGSRKLAKLLSKPVNAQKDGDFPKYPYWSDADKKAFQRVATLGPKYGYFYE